MLHLYDSMSRATQPIEKNGEGPLTLYTCGPTVYNRAHVGNFRTFVFEDVLRRWLDYRYTNVHHVMNLTDVEDKIIRNAAAANHTLDEETAPHIAGFFEDCDFLGIRRARDYPRATEYIPQMITLIQKLMDKGMAYSSDGSVYYRLSAFPAYGRLNHLVREQLREGASGRVDADEYERDGVSDFALWKGTDRSLVGWESPFGWGRPGWHIECSAMSMTLLGDTIDIHCGGVDNSFPHHENEIAQSEGATGVTFVRTWCHAAHLRIDGERMGKSLGNFMTLPGLLEEGWSRPTLRYLLAAGAHYRRPMNLSPENLHMAQEASERFLAFHRRVRDVEPLGSGSGLEEIAAQGLSQFCAAMDDDLNLAEGMGAFFVAARELNRRLDTSTPSGAEKSAMEALISRVDDVIALTACASDSADTQLDENVRKLLGEREAARAAKNFAKSDELRDVLKSKGIAVEDTAAGQRWSVHSPTATHG